ncbi:unnamed protein product [Paramecium sonneborni]|uniref:Transmembrane protein n=1 Tax=Paramecium sonneborni TaxID=65129 RepID=A0A8S1JSA7_9CILI|nr:unnamed protein product [Paramecium sonneborni]
MQKSSCNYSNFAQKLKKEMIHHFDIFSQSPNFTILKRSKYSSAIGFIISIMIGAFGFYFFITEVVSMISKSKPAVYQTELSIAETEPLFLKNDNFTLAISVVNRFSEPIIGIDRYFQLNISQCQRQRIKDENSQKISVKLNCTQIPIEICNMSHFTTELQKNYFSIIRMGGIQCINRRYLNNNSLTLQGQVTSWQFRYILIQFTVCQNTSQYKNCASKEEIETALESGHYNVYKSDYLTTLDHPDQPYQEIITNEFTSFSLSTSKTISQLYRIQQTTTDQGLIWEQIQQQSNIQQSEWREISEFYNNQYLIAHFIRLDYKLTNNIRTYVKLQTIIGKIGGIFQIFIMIIAIILRPIVENFMKLEMVNSLFNFCDQLQNQQHSNVTQKEKEIQIQLNRTQIQNQHQNHDLNNLSKNQQNSKLNSSNIQTWLIIFGCNKSKKKQFIIAKNKVNKNLEIVNILRKLQEIKILKKILLTNDQYIFLKKYRRKIDKNGDSQNQHQIQQNIISCSRNQDQFNQKNQLENFTLEQKSQFVLDQIDNQTPKNLFQKDIFNSCYKFQEIHSVNYAEIQEPISQTPKK